MKDAKYSFKLLTDKLVVQDVVSKDPPLVVFFPQKNEFLAVNWVYKRDPDRIYSYRRSRNIQLARYGSRTTFQTEKQIEDVIKSAKKKKLPLAKMDYVILRPKSQIAEFEKL